MDDKSAKEAIETIEISNRGQVIIPKRIRNYVGSKDEIFTILALDNETILMKKIDKKKLLHGFEGKGNFLEGIPG